MFSPNPESMWLRTQFGMFLAMEELLHSTSRLHTMFFPDMLLVNSPYSIVFSSNQPQ